MASDSPPRLTPIVDWDCDCDWYSGSHTVEKHGRQLRYDPAGFIHTPTSHSPPPCEECHWYYEDPLSSSAKDDEDGVEDDNRKDDDYGDPSEEDEDEDIRDLPEEAKIQYRELHSCIGYAPFFGIYFQRFYDRYPSKHPNYFKEFDRHPNDDMFLQQLANGPDSRSKQHPYPQHSGDSLAKQVVVDILFCVTEANSVWNKVRGNSLAAKDRVYTNAIKAAASLLFSLRTKDSLYRLGCKPTLDDQRVQLWKELELLDQKGHSVYEACWRIVQLTADKDKYSFLTECDIAEMLSGYVLQLSYGKFDYCPFNTGQVNLPPFVQDKIQMLHDIDKVVMEMEPSSPISQVDVDVYTRMLITLLKGSIYEQNVDLLNDAMKIVDTNTNRDEIIAVLLAHLLSDEMMRMKWQLADVLQPLFILSTNILGVRYVSHEILMIVQIAELRRMALGRRFIERSHLIWAFYECGYGFPRKVTYVNTCDIDHPPYHIYVAAMKIALASALKKVRLEHFLFAVLYAQDSISDGPKEQWSFFDGSKEHWSKMQQDFNDFVEDIALERTEVVSSLSSNSCDTGDRGE